jgi:hypothetical protein
MTFNTFKKAVDMCDESIAIGGGEPTLHPKFNDFLLHAIANVENVWLATNGSVTTTALNLAKLAKRGVVGVDLSQDSYHDDIDPAVVAAFSDMKRDRSSFLYENRTDRRSIRNTERNIIYAGRAKHLYEANKKLTCCEEGGIIKPDGSIWWCGCSSSMKIGDVCKGFYKKWTRDMPWTEYGCYEKWSSAQPRYFTDRNHKS